VALDVGDLSREPAASQLAERHLAALATLRADGTPHLVPVGFTFDAGAGLARVICSDGTQKVRNVERNGWAAVSQLDGPRWLTLEGPARINREAAAVAEAERRYGVRYGGPRPNLQRVVIEITVARVLGRVG
jgi:F420H(2)-dependent biliverdin reductase